MLTDYSRLSSAMLDRMETAVSAQAPHLLPLVQVVRDCGVGFLVVPQRASGLDRGIDLLARPFIVLVGDDMDSALGPDQYDRTALKRLIGQIDGVAIVCCEPPPEAFPASRCWPPPVTTGSLSRPAPNRRSPGPNSCRRCGPTCRSSCAA